ncbi:hypothetical protein DH86_00003576, partial [Scytalidium sp. 3C]
RQITFPPLAALSDPVNIYGGHGGSKEIIFDQEFYGLKTFANLPYVNCLADRDAVNGTYDIAVVGAPFDTSVTARPGARYGPSGIRTGSQRIDPAFSWSVYTGMLSRPISISLLKRTFLKMEGVSRRECPGLLG